MPIRVDLPAPFSPTMPWIEPALTTSEMFRFAWTSPNHLSIPRSSIAAAPLSSSRSDMVRSSELFSHVVGDLDLAGHDVGAGLLEPLLHVGGDESPVVLVERVADAALGHAERADARLPAPFLRGLERPVPCEVAALDPLGRDRPGTDVVLVRVDADGEPALVLRGLQHAEPGGARRRVDDVGAAGLGRSEEHTAELPTHSELVCRLLLDKKLTLT